ISFVNSKNIVIHNGSITGFTSCIDGTGGISYSVTLENLRISNCFHHGIGLFEPGGSGVVRNVYSANNGGYGIAVTGTFTITDNFAFNNGLEGILHGLC